MISGKLKKMGRAASSLLDVIDDRIAILAGIVVLVAMVVISYDVIMRYIFNAPTLWAYDVVTYLLLISIPFLAVSYCLKVKGHTSVDIIYNRLPWKARKIIDLVGRFAGLCFVGTLLWLGSSLAWRAFVMGYKSEVIGLPLFISKAIIPIGAFLLFLRLISDIFHIANSLRQEHNSSAQK